MPIEQQRQSLLHYFLDNLRAHLIASRFSERVYGSDLLPAEAFVLDYAGQYNHLSLTEIADILCLQVSRVSRILSRLEKAGYLISVPNEETGAKRKSWKLTKKGTSFIKLQAEYNAKQITTQLSHLSLKDAKKLANYLSQIADSSDGPKLPGTSETAAEMVLYSMRRLTIVHGLLGESYVGSDYSALDWLILSEVAYGDFNLTSLSARLQLPITNVNQRLRGAKLSKLITTQSQIKSEVGRKLQLTPSGGKALKTIENKAIKALEAGTMSFSLPELNDFSELFAEYVNSNVPLRTGWLSSEIRVEISNDNSENLEARWLLIQELKDTSREYPLGQKIFADENILLVIRKEARLLAALEIYARESGELVITNAVFSASAGKISVTDLYQVLQKLLLQYGKVSLNDLKHYMGYFAQ